MYFVTSMAGIVFKLASLDHAIEYAVGFVRQNERDLSPMTSLALGRVGRLLGGSATMATFRGDVLLTAFF